MGNMLYTPPMPPIDGRGVDIIKQYDITDQKLRKVWKLFVDKDIDRNGFWTSQECYAMVQEPKISMVSPMMDALIRVADRGNDGTLDFNDFCISFTSFCALNREEVLQFLFLVIDVDRNGYVTRDELKDFFEFTGLPKEQEGVPVFPVNNMHALDQFQKGSNWDRLYFDEFAQLATSYPYIPFAAFQLQELFRAQIIGKEHWKQWEMERNAVPTSFNFQRCQF